MIVWPPIAPTEILFRGINWQPRIGSDTIASSTWSTSNPPGLTVTPFAPPFSGYNTLVVISTPTIDITYTVINTIITTAGQKEVETVQVTCAPK